jgi:DNA-binding NarL/FixJ family response regulator
MRVVVAEDSGVIRAGLVRLLEDAGITVVADVADADAAIAAVDEHQPDVFVTDVRMPPTHTTEGLRAVETLRARHPSLAILVLSQYVETQHTIDLIGRDASGVGYLLKDRVGKADDFVDALHRIARGESVVDPEVVRRMLDRRRRDDPLERLTAREREVLALIAQGRSNSAICNTLFLNPKTVEGHVARIFTKLNLEPAADDHRRVLAVLTHLRAI